uniref:Small auxin up regulated protein n=1 Tax=Kalanchoe fedtschenkoi TaxID=63787 RepID=A0A7N0T512_KALFE
MGFRLSGVVQAKKLLRRSLSGSRQAADVPKGCFAVYVGENKARFVVPVAYLNQPAFQELLSHAEEEYGFDHPNGGLTIPCSEDEFSQLTSQLN